MAVERVDEVLDKAVSTDTSVIPRYDVVRPDGTKVAENVELVLKNPILTPGTPFNRSVLNEVLAASGVTTGSNSKLLLRQDGFVPFNGALVRVCTHLDPTMGATLNINSTGDFPVVDSGGNITKLPNKSWATLIYDSNKYILVAPTAATIMGQDPPGATTAAAVGTLYYCISESKMYFCISAESGAYEWRRIISAAPSLKTEVITATTTWNKPVNLYSQIARVVCVGGGGSNGGSSGGGSGRVVEAEVDLTDVQSVTCTVGAADAATSFGTLVTAVSGGKGTASKGGDGAAGGGGAKGAAGGNGELYGGGGAGGVQATSGAKTGGNGGKYGGGGGGGACRTGSVGAYGAGGTGGEFGGSGGTGGYGSAGTDTTGLPLEFTGTGAGGTGYTNGGGSGGGGGYGGTGGSGASPATWAGGGSAGGSGGGGGYGGKGGNGAGGGSSNSVGGGGGGGGYGAPGVSGSTLYGGGGGGYGSAQYGRGGTYGTSANSGVIIISYYIAIT